MTIFKYKLSLYSIRCTSSKTSSLGYVNNNKTRGYSNYSNYCHVNRRGTDVTGLNHGLFTSLIRLFIEDIPVYALILCSHVLSFMRALVI